MHLQIKRTQAAPIPRRVAYDAYSQFFQLAARRHSYWKQRLAKAPPVTRHLVSGKRGREDKQPRPPFVTRYLFFLDESAGWNPAGQHAATLGIVALCL